MEQTFHQCDGYIFDAWSYLASNGDLISAFGSSTTIAIHTMSLTVIQKVVLDS